LRPKTALDAQRLMEFEGVSLVVPLDHYLRLSNLPFKMTPGVMLEVARVAQLMTYPEAANELSKKFKYYISATTVRSVTDFIGKIIFDDDCNKADKARGVLNLKNNNKNNKFKNYIMYIQVDGSMLYIRYNKNDVTKKSNTGDLNQSIWQETKLGMIFSSNNIKYWINSNGEEQHRIKKREYINYFGTYNEFKYHLLACALRNGYGSFGTTIILSDGAEWIKSIKDELFYDSIQILDFYHLSEHIHDFAKIHFINNEEKCACWAKQICSTFKHCDKFKAIKSIENLKTNQKDKKDKLLNYINNNINIINYKEYLEKKYFIGSGAIESANKSVVQQRLKQAGMRWNHDTAQSLIALRAKYKSGLWNNVVEPTVYRYLGFTNQ
jgi:hypothetical protein